MYLSQSISLETKDSTQVISHFSGAFKETTGARLKTFTFKTYKTITETTLFNFWVFYKLNFDLFWGFLGHDNFSLKQGHRDKSRAFDKQNVKTLKTSQTLKKRSNSQKLSITL